MIAMNEKNSSQASSLVCRVDRLTVPFNSREEFLAQVASVQKVVREQEGFVQNLVLEDAEGSENSSFLVIVEWESPEHMQAAGSAVAAMLKASGFDRKGHVR
jgi:heme-degrading monooxygenase HmoA